MNGNGRIEMTIRANGLDRKVAVDGLELNNAQRTILRRAIRSVLEMSLPAIGGTVELPAMHERFGKITKVINWNRI